MMTEGDRSRAIAAEVVARAWREPAYADQLKKNPKAVLVEAGIPIAESKEVVLLENTMTVFNAVLPAQEDAARYQAQLDKAVQMLPLLPAGVEVRINRDSATRTYFVLPMAPVTSGELSDADLEQVAGGKGEDAGGGGAVMGVLIGSGGAGDAVSVVQTVAVGNTVAVVQVAVQAVAAVSTVSAAAEAAAVVVAAIVLI